jgi:DNA-binding beta-propeller fold protein YncE
MKVWALAAAMIAAGLVAACGGNKTTINVVVAPATSTVIQGGNQQFTATVTGTSTTSVTWSVCTAAPNTTPAPTCNVTSLGVVNSNGLYTAPSKIPNPDTILVVATSTSNVNYFGTSIVTIDSGVRVTVIPATYNCTDVSPPGNATIAALQSYGLLACVTGTQNTAVNWSVNGVAGGNLTDGFITPGGVYTAPSTSPGAITITATSQQDPTQSGTFSITISSTGVPTVTALSPPTVVEQGSFLQDVYVTGTGFLSTSNVLVNGSLDPNAATTFISSTLLRVRLLAPLLTSTAPIGISVQSQCPPDCSISNTMSLNIIPVRPGLISETPVNVPQASPGTTSVTLTGGFYSPATALTFDGVSQPASILNSRQLNAVLSSSNFTSAGLSPIVAENSGVASGMSPEAAINLAISPLSGIPTAANSTVAVGSGPTAVAINTATDTAVVANTAAGTITLVNLVSGTASPAIAVGKSPTGVGVDNILNEAVVVNSADNTFSVVNLATGTAAAPVTLPAEALPTSVPFSVAINPLTHRGLIANESTNVATVIDLTTTPATVLQQVGGASNPVSTGATPQVAIDPILNWAVITPGGAGTISIVDLGQPASQGTGARLPNVVATLTLTTTVTGLSINTETHQAFFTDPANTSVTTFSLLDQSVTAITYQKAQLASAVNPLTNIGLTINNLAGLASVFDLGSQLFVQTISVGSNPQAIAIDPTSDVAVVVNENDNDVALISLGALRTPQITETSPTFVLSSITPISLNVIGDGFEAGAVVRLDGTPVVTSSVPTACPASPICRELVATVPANLLGSARRYVVDVLNPDSTVSNAESFSVIQPVAVGDSPVGVAVDSDLDTAIVTNSGSNDVSFVNLTTGTASAPLGVGTTPIGVASIPRLGRAIVTNSGSNDVSIIDEINQVVLTTLQTCATCLGPTGVAINQDTAQAVIANTQSNNVVLVAVDTLMAGPSIPVDQMPLSVAIDPVRNYAAVTAAPPPQFSPSNTVSIINLATNDVISRMTGFEDPTDAVYDPSEDQFLVTDSLNNNLVIIDPGTFIQTRVRVGIDPTSLDYNFQTSTLLTVNSASNTISVTDLVNEKVQLILAIEGSQQFSVAIDNKLNLAVVVDQNNNRVLLVPVPR